MKIKTITCHDVYNHGASLQAYALQTYLESQGHEVEIIDYKPPHLSGHYNLWSVNNPVYDKPLVRSAYVMTKLPGRLRGLQRKKAFDQFTRQYLKRTRRYNSYEELEADPPEADAYIAGSDQIWNTLFQNGRDKAFYLAFAPKDKLKLSYAASFSTPDIQEEFRPFVSQMLKGIDRISIREKSSLALLSSLGRSDGVAVCDPVFLLSPEDWRRLISPVESREDYLLVYDTENSETVRAIAMKLSRKKHLAVYNVSAFKFGYADKNFPYAGPLKFLRLIESASYVVSNSFHATAFSLIFGREFCVVNRSENINERMLSLLNDYGLHERMASSGGNETIFNPIDYGTVTPILRQGIRQSKEFLGEVLAFSTETFGV